MIMNLNDLILTIIREKVNSRHQLEKLMRQYAKEKVTPIPKKYQLLRQYQMLLKKGRLTKQPWLEELLLAKPVRTLSGVTPLTVLLKPYPCPGECIYCPDQAGIPKSYLADEPAVLRAKKLDFNPFEQVKYRLWVFKLMGHQVSKIELIILGGTFSSYPKQYRVAFIKKCFDACNQQKSVNLSAAQKANQSARRKIIGITVETRPDLVNEQEIKFWRQLGVTRVELGVQSLYPVILKTIRRGHALSAIVKATKLLKDNGFKVCYHLMPGLPGSDFTKDLAMFKKTFSNSHFRPDFVKIYPCVVLKESPLYQDWLAGKFRPLEDRQLVKLLVSIKKNIPEYVRINRLGRDIPIANIVAGYRYSHIREMVQEELQKQKSSCQCIRCREIREGKFKDNNLKLKISRYPASGGREFFLQIIDSDNRLHALLRLRFPGKNRQDVFPVLKGAALVRELHTFGQSLALTERKKPASQHRGLGKKLLEEAEKISRQNGFLKVAVIAGVGVRDYYRRLGYQLRQTYVIKRLLSD
ncbi:MAG TPA: tRNA uridine(34) 5-carboxymethylaminomethyl modification radical SAM/GNAT enzyme Elp3 [Candidatus Bathyarchaeia archaeon]|nr:tRNA uridine(34) 5-carboxymethylaminomethyl modification radical SAM/GNAT enzyme Elp3 [Candidatus Bathyarchaeia archaeon]